MRGFDIILWGDFMNEPIVIVAHSFQDAWAQAVVKLKLNGWKVWNLVVQIDAPSAINSDIQNNAMQFAKQHGLITPVQVAHTIFPYKYYKAGISRDRLYKLYWRYFKYTRSQAHRGWGTYFERMIRYAPGGDPNKAIDQLSTIIDAINGRNVNYGAAYTIVILYPQKDGKRKMGAPCLNYLTVQVETVHERKKRINLLAVYRNHDFLERAYGNYLGLCKLLEYIATETSSDVGCLTCISSHAYVPNYKRELYALSNSIMGAGPV